MFHSSSRKNRASVPASFRYDRRSARRLSVGLEALEDRVVLSFTVAPIMPGPGSPSAEVAAGLRRGNGKLDLAVSDEQFGGRQRVPRQRRRDIQAADDLSHRPQPEHDGSWRLQWRRKARPRCGESSANAQHLVDKGDGYVHGRGDDRDSHTGDLDGDRRCRRRRPCRHRHRRLAPSRQRRRLVPGADRWSAVMEVRSLSAISMATGSSTWSRPPPGSLPTPWPSRSATATARSQHPPPPVSSRRHPWVWPTRFR